MKVVHYLSEFSRISETFISDLIVALEKIPGTQNSIITQLRLNKEHRPFENVTIFKDRANILDKIICRLLPMKYAFYHEKKFANLIKSLKPDIIHAHFGPNAISVYRCLIKNKIKIPLVISLHGMDVNSLPKVDKNYHKFFLKMINDPNTYVVVPSQFLMNKLQHLDIDQENSNIHVIPNSFNKKYFAVDEKIDFNRKENFQIINVGRLESVKGQRYLLEAIAKTKKYFPKVTLKMVGAGSLLNKLQYKVTELGINENVRFLGERQHIDVARLLGKSHLFIQSSIINDSFEEESFGLALLEAMSMGILCIGTEIGGIPELLIHRKTGLLVDQKDSIGLANAIIDCIKNYDKYCNIRNEAKLYVSQNFSQDRQVKLMSDLYRGAINDV